MGSEDIPINGAILPIVLGGYISFMNGQSWIFSLPPGDKGSPPSCCSWGPSVPKGGSMPMRHCCFSAWAMTSTRESHIFHLDKLCMCKSISKCQLSPSWQLFACPLEARGKTGTMASPTCQKGRGSSASLSVRRSSCYPPCFLWKEGELWHGDKSL